MSDLISRSELIKEINGIYLHVSGVRSGKGILSKCMDSYKELVIKTIKEQPTAFDTEKVVEQLEERKAYASGCFGVMCSDCKYTEECHEGEKGYKVAFDSAIDIVKKGGVE